ncbi:MAG: hypothetical protein R2706_20390 [Acidimicrobiales bacterium]
MAYSRVCDEVLSILAQPGLSDDNALHRARIHSATCPHCSAQLEDGVASDAPAFGPKAVSNSLRIVLVGVAALQLAIAVPWLLGRNPLGDLGDHVEVAHLTRDGALGLTTAIAGLLTAWRPRYAVPAVAVSCVALLAQFAMAFVDDHAHRVGLAFEGIHIVTVAIVALVAIHGKQSAVRPTAGPRRMRSIDS